MSTHRIARRGLLRAGALGGAGLLLAACSDSTEPAAEPSPAAPTGDALPDTADIAQRALDAAGVDAPLALTPIVATFELLTGAGRVPFGVLDAQNEPLLDVDVEAWVVDESGAVAAGPVTPTFYGEGLGTRGVYVAEVELPTAGILDLVVVADTDDGPLAGTAALRVVEPADSTTYPPGATLPVVSTPTVDAPGELEELCTLEPDCSMHGVDAATVLGSTPVVLTVATPLYCQTAVCGPVVQVVEQVRDELGRDDVTYVHAEVYTDAGITPTEPVEELGLPSEPWTWVVAADGTVVDRFDGPVVPDLLRAALDRL